MYFNGTIIPVERRQATNLRRRKSGPLYTKNIKNKKVSVLDAA